MVIVNLWRGQKRSRKATCVNDWGLSTVATLRPNLFSPLLLEPQAQLSTYLTKIAFLDQRYLR